jgi:hypothetical protein
MNIKFTSKNNIGFFASLILFILLSQSNMFNFLVDTYLGRAFLIFIILGISYLNKILGVVAVLFIIIMFNQSNIGYVEGLTNSANPTTHSIDSKNETKKSTTDPSISKSTSNIAQNGIEGFNMIEKEGMILKGKSSNSVHPIKNTSENFEPTDKSIFTTSYSSI